MGGSFNQRVVVEDGWKAFSKPQSNTSLTLLASWELWNEQNERVFHNKHAPSFAILENIKNEALLWALEGAMRLGKLLLWD
jgi:hypothetical protein